MFPDVCSLLVSKLTPGHMMMQLHQSLMAAAAAAAALALALLASQRHHGVIRINEGGKWQERKGSVSCSLSLQQRRCFSLSRASRGPADAAVLLSQRRLSSEAGGDENLWIAFRTQYKEATRCCILPQGRPSCRSAVNKHTLVVVVPVKLPPCS